VAQDNLFWVLGVGGSSCGEYLHSREEELKARPVNPEQDAVYSMNYLAFSSYANGFLTGTNIKSIQPTDGSVERLVGQSSDGYGRMLWLENYCREHPLDNYLSALMMLRKYLVNHAQ
jgi:hypothetical protein